MANPPTQVRDLAEKLSARAEQVCRHYLPKGRREGRYWLVGDVDGTPGRSLYVRLEAHGAARGAAGKWIDAATGQHGDLLDLIAANRSLHLFGDIVDEARRFLTLPPATQTTHRIGRAADPSVRARRLFSNGVPLTGTLAETYLRARGLAPDPGLTALRFHARCWHWRGEDRPREDWPALLGAVTDNDGVLTAVHRTWLARDGADKAPLETPRRAMGAVMGHAIRFGFAEDTMIAGEGIETMLSLRRVLPAMPLAACTSATHLALFDLPHTLRRLYVARDRDPAGAMAFNTLAARTQAGGIETLPLDPDDDDFNADLKARGVSALISRLAPQLHPVDFDRFSQPS